MGENIKLRRVGKDQTRVMSLRGYNLLSERDRKKWEVVDGEVEETTKKKTVHVVDAGVKNTVADFSPFVDARQVETTTTNSGPSITIPGPETTTGNSQEIEDLTALQAEYKELTGKDPKGNWKAKRLSEEIQKVKDGSHEAE